TLADVATFLPRTLILNRAIRAAMNDVRGDEARESRARRLSRVATAVARYWPTRPLCLKQSLAVYWLLRFNGIGSRLRIGVQSQGDDLLAHAWVEVVDRPINERSTISDTYATFDVPSYQPWASFSSRESGS